ncbi:MAG TPA: transglycosylase SLT domain-containing protein [Bryobacteraceae bacterium]|nr:transglycosylase SLT domain-containing protein [Bryobacteraceae bacterium]
MFKTFMPQYGLAARRSKWAAGFLIGLFVLAVFTSGAADPLADLKSGADALEGKRYAVAIATLKPVAKRLPKLADYSNWFLASAELESKNYAEAVKDAEAVLISVPPSPLGSRAVLLAARAHVQNSEPAKALEVLRKHYDRLPQPQGDLAMARAFSAAGDSVSAAASYQRVFYNFPLSTEAPAAEAESEKLRVSLGEKYPPAMPNAMLGRALKLLESGRAALARKELEALVPKLGGVERDIARVRIGVAQYNAKDTLRAHAYLSALKVESPEADAERLHYLLLASRRLKNQDDVNAALNRLARLYPNSKWRMEALIASANHYLLQNQIASYEPLYRACYESFPGEPQAAGCHWKVTWGHYLRRNQDAGDLLRAHLRLFPSAETAAGALYFLGRLAENAGDNGSARAYYEEITREYPNYYYTVQARVRLPHVASAAVSGSATAFLRSVKFPERVRSKNFEANAAAKLRLERSRMLVQAGLEDWAEVELRFGAQTEDQSHVLAAELASIEMRRENPSQAIRFIKRYASGYLYLPLETAPTDFWRLAFPLPFRSDLERFSKQNGLDPFLMAALIRQESEFDAKVISRANARGLTQILPSTGKELSRRLKVAPYTTAALFKPATNLQLGTFYLKTMIDHLGGNVEAALAAYNAGLSRANAWLSWGDFKEPAEFIETVPFTETRGYIQTVLRNADVYRRLYGSAAGPRAGLNE